MISHSSSYTTDEGQTLESLNPLENTVCPPVRISDKTDNETLIDTNTPVINTVQVINTQGLSLDKPVIKNIDELLLNLSISERKEVIHQELYGLVKKLKPFLAKTVTDYLMVKFVCIFVFVHTCIYM
jgi:hypothetical protein